MSTEKIVPVGQGVVWRGRDFSSDDYMFHALNSLNEPYCSNCKRWFWQTYHAENSNIFAGKLQSTMIWNNKCSQCDGRPGWQEMNGSLIKWKEQFEWDMILTVLEDHLSKDIKNHFAIEIFMFLARIQGSFPAENSILWSEKVSQDEIRSQKDKLEAQLMGKEKHQTDICDYFKIITKKRKATNPDIERYLAKQQQQQQNRKRMTCLLKATNAPCLSTL